MGVGAAHRGAAAGVVNTAMDATARWRAEEIRGRVALGLCAARLPVGDDDSDERARFGSDSKLGNVLGRRGSMCDVGS